MAPSTLPPPARLPSGPTRLRPTRVTSDMSQPSQFLWGGRGGGGVLARAADAAAQGQQVRLSQDEALAQSAQDPDLGGCVALGGLMIDGSGRRGGRDNQGMRRAGRARRVLSKRTHQQ